MLTALKKSCVKFKEKINQNSVSFSQVIYILSMRLMTIAHIFFAVLLVAMPVRASTVAEVIKEVENEISSNSGPIDAAGAKKEKNAQCRAQLRTRYSGCKTKSCKDSALTEFKFCTVSQVKTVREKKQKEAFAKAENLKKSAIKPDSCLSILRQREVCGKNEKCRSRLWKEYQSCLNKFSEEETKDMPKQEEEEKLSPEELKEFQISIQRLQHEAEVARAKLEKSMTDKKRTKLQAELKEKQKQLEELKKKSPAQEKAEVAAEKTKKAPATTPVKAISKPIIKAGASGFEAVKAHHDCQNAFKDKIKASQKKYQLNPLPRFDNTYVESVRAAHTEMKACAASKKLGKITVPYDEGIHTTAGGVMMRSPTDCERAFASDLDKKCGNDWGCRNKAQQKAWMCKALVSLPK